MNQLVTEARALCEGATEGPWKINKDHDCIVDCDAQAVIGTTRWGDAAFAARSRTLIPEMAAEIERLEGIIESNRIPLLQYASLRKNFHALVRAVLGEDYYNMGMDVYTCDAMCCRDIAYECSRRAGKKFDEALTAMKEDSNG